MLTPKFSQNNMDYEEDYFDNSEYEMDEMEFEEEDEKIDFSAIEELARRKLLFHITCSLSSFGSLSCLYTEAELLLHFHDYQSALATAVAADLASKRTSPTRLAIAVICTYQMGARSEAVKLMETCESQVVNSSEVSSGLKKKFVSTCEVLRFMPQLMAMLRAGPPNKS